MNKRVTVAMSGGVDSSVAAMLLLDQGYEVEGLTMRLWHEDAHEGAPSESARAAQEVCRYLGFAHREVDLRQAFRDRVVDYFVREYARGRTPNPCALCNRTVKFGLAWKAARQAGCVWFATGHYVRVAHSSQGWQLLAATDRRKDQSYFLYALGQEQLGSLLFPLGEMTKPQVRALARQRGLPVAERSESQDICFLRDGDYRRFLREHLGEAMRPGPIYDCGGARLGTHQGLALYTVGQREGLGIAAPKALYVLALDPSENALIVGFAEELGRSALLAEEMSYIAGIAPVEGLAVEATIRYRAQRVAAHVWPLPEQKARVVLERPLRDISPGQAIVLYEGASVLGGGIITQALAG